LSRPTFPSGTFRRLRRRRNSERNGLMDRKTPRLLNNALLTLYFSSVDIAKLIDSLQDAPDFRLSVNSDLIRTRFSNMIGCGDLLSCPNSYHDFHTCYPIFNVKRIRRHRACVVEEAGPHKTSEISLFCKSISLGISHFWRN
jgi:hypothetical protein